MRKLKPLNNFKIENSILERDQMRLVTGGSNQTECMPTCTNNVEDSKERGRRDHPGPNNTIVWDDWTQWMEGGCTCYQIIHSGC